MEIRKAQRRKAKLRLGMSAPSGYGKTYSSLLIAFGIGGKVGIIDTEQGSADLYSDLGDYDVLTLAPPYSPARYVEAIRAFERAGYDTIIVDSLTHAWSGEGGSLDRQGKIADKSGNSWQAWRQVTPEHNALVEALLQSKCHIIATMRAKTEYVQEKDERTGKNVVKKIGLAPIMRDGIEYEFTVFFEIGPGNMASASKDRTRIFADQFFKPTVETGEKLKAWLEAGADAPEPKAMGDEQFKALKDAIDTAETREDLFAAFSNAYRAATAIPDPSALALLNDAKDTRKALLEQQSATTH